MKGSYQLIDTVYDDEETPDEQAKKLNDEVTNCKLDPRLSELIKLIFDVKLQNKALIEIGYDVKKMPLGKLSQGQIDKAYAILKLLSAEIDKGKQRNANKMSLLSSEFYTNIPHDVGFKDMRTLKIVTKEMVQEKLDLLDALSNMKITKNITNSTEGAKSILESNYEKLKNKITPVDKTDKRWALVDDFIKKGKAPTHNNYALELLECFDLEREGEAAKFRDDIGNSMMLWHGSRLTNFVGILSQGMRIAPPEAPATGYMFGKGVYFADMVTKSANYCFHHLSNNIGLLLICEVALGTPRDLLHSDYNASNLPAGRHSTKGCGGTGPDPKNFKELDGVPLPMGPGVNQKVNGSLLYNEFIVYNVDQVKMRYLVKCRFK